MACSSASSRVLRHLHAAALAAAACMNLRLHHHAVRALREQFARHGVRFFQRVGHFALWHGHAILRQDLFRLILVNFHVGLNRLPAAVGVARRGICACTSGSSNTILRSEGPATRRMRLCPQTHPQQTGITIMRDERIEGPPEAPCRRRHGPHTRAGCRRARRDSVRRSD